MKIAICGGGNLGHVCAGFLSASEDNQVSLLTRNPTMWSRHIDVTDCKGNVFHGELYRVSSQPEEVIPSADIVLLCLPGFAIKDELKGMAPYLSSSCLVGTVVSNTGFFFAAFDILSRRQPLFGFQRVPFIARITHYGKEAELKGYKESLSVAVEQTHNKEQVRSILEWLFKTPVNLLNSHYEVSLSNSNPLLHTSRLYTMWRDWKPGISFERNPMFYSEWTIEASELYIAMDMEFQKLLRNLGLSKDSIPCVLEYYESTDADSLTKKIRSIPAFQGILSPMVVNKFGKYEPDFLSRYFTEDFTYGLRIIHDLAHEHLVFVPDIDRVYNWGIGLTSVLGL